MKITIIIMFFVISANSLFAQQAQQQKMKLADSYEKAGDFKNASRIWEELYQANPSSEEFLQGLIRTYKLMNRFTDLLPIIESKLEIKKTSYLLSLYGELLWRAGKAPDANKAWEEALDKFGEIESAFINVSDAQIALQLFDKAIATLQKGRNSLNKPDLFTESLCRLYIATGNYKTGVKEIVSLLIKNNNLPLAQGMLYALMTSKEAITYLKNDLSAQSSQYSNFVNIQMLFAWFLRTSNIYDEALEIYKRIDKLMNAGGRELLSFADVSRQDGQFDIALKAYGIIIDMGKGNPFAASALYGYAHTMELKIQQKNNGENSFSKDDIKDILGRYNKIINDYPNTPTAADCLYRMAMLYSDVAGDFASAKEKLNLLSSAYPRLEISARAYLMLGSILTNEDKLDESQKIYKSVVFIYNSLYPVEVDIAIFKSAEIDYFMGNIDTALAQFINISKNSSSDVANDAIKKIVLIEQNLELTKGLKVFAEAELREMQKKYEKAINLFLEASEIATGTELAELSLVRAADLMIKTKKNEKARDIMLKLIEKYPDTIYGDYACLFIGNTYFAESRKEDALKYFNNLLTKYPKSIYLKEARHKIRVIRNEEM